MIKHYKEQSEPLKMGLGTTIPTVMRLIVRHQEKEFQQKGSLVWSGAKTPLDFNSTN